MVCYPAAAECVQFLATSKTNKDILANGDETRDAYVKRLRPHFTCSSYQANLSNVEYDVHPALKALWLEAEEWHLLSTDHCDVYGFNIWPPAWLKDTSDMVFKGGEARARWFHKKKRVGAERGIANWSCASEGWVCCMAFSEHDYLLVCSDKESERFGHVHHINNDQGKEEFCCQMDELLHHLLTFVEEGEVRRKRKNEGKLYTDDSTNRAALVRPLRLVRKAVIDAKMKQGVNVNFTDERRE